MIRRTVARTLAGVLVAGAVPIIAVAVSATEAPNTFSSSDLATYQTNGVAWTIAEANGKVFVGGTFTAVRPPGAAAGVNEIARTNFAVFDAATGSPTSCAPSFDLPSNPSLAGVRALNVSPDKQTLYVGGFFSSINGGTAQHLAALDIASCSVVNSFRPTPNGMIRAIQSTSTTVYFGGAFGLIAGQSRNRAAAVGAVGSATPGTALSWAPAFDNDVRAMALAPDGSALAVGGWFDTVNGANSHALGVVSTNSGANVRTYPGLIEQNSRVHDLAADSTGFYTAHDGYGAFDGRIAFNWSNYEQRWIDSCLGATQAVTVYNGILYSGSHAHNCESMGSFPDGPRYHFLAQSVNNTTLLPWFPNTDDGIGEQIGPRDMVAATSGAGNFLWAVGEFTQVNGKPQQGITRFGEGAGTAGPSMPTVAVTSSNNGQVRVAWRRSLDTDDATLTYHVYRDGGTSPIHSVSGKSWFWERRQLTYTDSGLAPGSVHRYRVEATDGAHTVSTGDRSVTVASNSSAYASRVIADGASFLWRYDDSRDVLMSDATANDNNGTLRGVSERVKPGAISGDPSGALDLPGNTTTIYSETRYPIQSSYSQETWFKTTSTTGGKLIGFGSNQIIPSGPYDKHIYLTNNGNVVFGAYSPAGTVTVRSPSSYNDGGWHHVVATQGTGGMTLYVDGARVGSNGESRSEAFAGFIRVGGDNLTGWPEAPSSYHFSGTLDETALYPSALSGAAVAEHYRLGTSGGPVVVGDTTAPTTPSGVTATANGTTVNVSWTASSDDTAVTGYDVYRSTTSGFAPEGTTLVGSVAGTSFANTSVSAGTWYYRVVAKDAAGNRSVASGAASVDVGTGPVADTSAPSTPTNLSASVGGSTVSLTWAASSDNVGVTTYEVHRSVTSRFTPTSATLTGSSSGTSFSQQGVPAGTWYYRVIARDAANNRSAPSAQVSAPVAAVVVDPPVVNPPVDPPVVDPPVVDPPVIDPPVVVAPGVVEIAPNADSYVNAAAPGTGYGTTEYLAQSAAPSMISYLRFAVPPTPAGKTLTGAVLRLHSTADSRPGWGGYQLIQLANDSWSESSITWNNRPAMSTGAFAFIAPPAADTSYSATLVPYFLQTRAGQDATLAITGLSASPLRSWSKESATASFRPRLILTYS